MIRLAFVLGLVVALGACAAPNITGIAAGVGENVSAPRRPLADPELATFQFELVPDIPVTVSDEFLRRIWRRAEREGLQVVKRPGGPALFTVEGTMTAVTDDTNSLIFFTFDVYDTAGRRLHRISGQQGSERDRRRPVGQCREPRSRPDRDPSRRAAARLALRRSLTAQGPLPARHVANS